MNSVFLYGNSDTKLSGLLQKLGYSVLTPHSNEWLAELVTSHPDVIVLDGTVVPEFSEVCAFLRSQQATREVPIVCIAPTSEDGSDSETLAGLSRIEQVPAPYSVGSLVGKIATQLRLCKLNGQDEHQASLAEMNLALRDYTERFNRELQEARTIQHSLLPQSLPKDPRFEVAVSHQSLDEVGGDWYYVQQEQDGRISLYISDVSGHGLSASFISSMTKLATTAAFDASVDKHLSKTASLLGAQLPAGRFVTMAMARYAPDTGVVQWARAGHPPALLVRPSTGEVVELKGDGFPVGFIDDPSYGLVEATLAPGDLLLIYTDGVSEVQNRAMEVYGLEQLAKVLHKNAQNKSAAEILAAVVDAVDEFRDGRLLKDDVTLVLLKRSL